MKKFSILFFALSISLCYSQLLCAQSENAEVETGEQEGVEMIREAEGVEVQHPAADPNALISPRKARELEKRVASLTEALAEAQQSVVDPNTAIYLRKAQHLEQRVALLTQALEELQQPVADPNAAIYQRKAQELEKRVASLTKQLAEAQQPVSDPNAAIYQRKAQELEKRVASLTEALAEAQQLVTDPNALIYQRKAQQLETKVTELSQELSIAQHTLGQIYTQKKMYPQAIDAYDKAMRYNPENKLAYYHAGLLYAYMGNAAEKAVDLFNQYLTMDNRAEYKDKAQQFIKLLSDK